MRPAFGRRASWLRAITLTIAACITLSGCELFVRFDRAKIPVVDAATTDGSLPDGGAPP